MLAGKVKFSIRRFVRDAYPYERKAWGGMRGSCDEPLRPLSSEAGEASRLKFAGEESFLLGCGGRGETSVVGGSEKTSDGVSISGVKALPCVTALGGNAGKDLSVLGAPPVD